MIPRPGFAFAAGVATFFAPCAFPLLPGYVAFYLGGDEPRGGSIDRLARAGLVGGMTSLGFFLVYAALAAIVAALGGSALADIAMLEPAVGGLLVVLGVATAAGYTPARHVPLPARRRSLGGYLAFGVVYAVAAAGCTAPVFIGLALLGLSAGPAGAVATLGAYAAGMAVVMLAVTGLSALGRDAVLRRLTRSTGRVTRVAGVLLALAGIAQIYLYAVGFDWLAPFR